MKKLTVAFLFLSLAPLLSGTAFSEPSIGVVDVNLVFSSYYRVAESQQEFSVYQQERTAELEKKAAAIEPLQQKLRDPETSEAEMEALQEQVSDLRREITESYRNLQQELQDKNHSLVEARVDEITAAIAEIGKQKECRLVINREAVLYEGPGTIDLTQDTIEHLNRNAPPSPAEN